MQKLLGYTRRAVESYRMLEDGDRVAVGVSGGKDSVALLTALAKLRDVDCLFIAGDLFHRQPLLRCG